MKKGAIHDSWYQLLSSEFDKPYFFKLSQQIKNDIRQGKFVYPQGRDIFAAFNTTPFDEVKVVILGQDPYHGLGQAHGLAFSVCSGIPIPPSLSNIFLEIQSDLGRQHDFSSGNLTQWASQGVLLLNASLTVLDGEPMSHSKIGWHILTDKVVETINQYQEHIVFLLWGKFAGAKQELIDASKHLILKAPHPSPLSAHSGFFGCKHFSKTNEYLNRYQRKPIEWYI